MTRPESPLALLDRIPPRAARTIARHLGHVRGKPLTHLDIAKASGLSLPKVIWIASLPSWQDVTVGDADAFLRGCGITLRNQCQHLRFIRRTQQSSWPMAHLAKLRPGELKTILKTL